MRKLLKFGCAALAAALSFPIMGFQAAHASTKYPEKTVRIVVPYAAGGATDITARIIATELGKLWGQAVIVDNKGGAGGVIGTQEVVRSAPDGHTVLLQSGTITIDPSFKKNLPYDVTRDLVAVTNAIAGPFLIVSNTKRSYESLQDFIKTANADSGSLFFGSPGIGTSIHLTSELFKSMAKVDIRHVAYKGSGPALLALMSDETQLLLDPISTSKDHVISGKVRALAVTGKSRAPLLPDVPTVAESGIPGFESTVWYGFFAPAGTPPEVVQKFYEGVHTVLNQDEIRAKFEAQGLAVVANSPKEFSDYVKSETERWAKVIKEAGIGSN